MDILIRGRKAATDAYLRFDEANASDLPPWYCANLKTSAIRCRPDAIGESNVGDPSASFKIVEAGGNTKILILERGEASLILTRVALEDFQLAKPLPGHHRLITSAMQDLFSFDPEAWETVTAFISLIVFVEARSTTTKLFSSTSFYELPHCVFFTNAVFAHIAPDIVFPGVTLYAAQENLFHEALHQQLILSWLERPALIQGQSGVRLVYSPWRGTHWPLEHAIQVAYVYKHVAALRLKAAERTSTSVGDAAILAAAAKKAAAAANLLRTGILAHAGALTAEGRLLTEGLLTSVPGV